MFVCSECGAAQTVPGFCPTDGRPLAPIGDDLLLGTVIGPYRVARLLGIGGMGRVYKGVHPSIGSRVAIKVLSRECSDRRDLVERFFAEAKAVNVIRHESIVNVLDLAMLPDGRPYIIMAYLDGAPLAGLVEAAAHQGQRLPIGGVARLCAEVLDALSAAHGKGIVHRDLKPDNIFVAPSGRPKVLDFGIAKLSDVSNIGSSTRTGSLLGTPHYMSPEQAAGRAVDHRTDLYAMGVILFECITGQKPFNADSLFDLLRKHVELPPPPPRSLRPELPPALEQVILVALAKNPDERFANAQAMSMALQHATQGLSPEQWAPLTPGAATGTMPNGGWSPSQPASWGGRSSVPSTVSSGQVTTPRPASTGSKKGLWIALGLVLLVGGGVTAGVLASQGADDSTSVAAKPAEPVPTPVTTPTPTTPTPPTPTTPTTPDDSLDQQLAQMDKMVEEQIKNLPAETQAQVRKQMEQYKEIAKLPPDQQMAKAMELPEQLLEQMDDPTAGGAAPIAATGPLGPDEWFKNLTPVPGGPYDANKLPVDPYIRWAIDEAKKKVPDAELTWISVDGVYPDGHADPQLVEGYVDLRFLSPSRAKKQPNVPRGAKIKDRQCEFRIMAGDSMGPPKFLDMSDFGNCKTKTVPTPRCTLKQVWKKALAKKPDLADAVASVIYTSNIASHKIVWMFNVKDDDETVFSEQFPDDC